MLENLQINTDELKNNRKIIILEMSKEISKEENIIKKTIDDRKQNLSPPRLIVYSEKQNKRVVNPEIKDSQYLIKKTTPQSQAQIKSTQQFTNQTLQPIPYSPTPETFQNIQIQSVQYYQPIPNVYHNHEIATNCSICNIQLMNLQ